jgi:endonuclease YncB( thermonuclease family)
LAALKALRREVVDRAILAGAADAQTATDGDTIKFNGTTWRLWGIHAPRLVNRAWMDGMPA